MRKWALTLHFYQPPTQDLAITREILETCYLPVVEALQKNPHAHLTFNLAGSLLRQLQQLNGQLFFDKVNELIQRGQVELLASPMYHPILPLTSSSVIKSQIEEHVSLLDQLFPRARVSGVYPPELAMDDRAFRVIRDYSKFCLVDEGSVDNSWSYQRISSACYRWGDYRLFSSSRLLTAILKYYQDDMTSHAFTDFFLRTSEPDQIIVSTNDAELFGHHYRKRIQFLAQILAKKEISFITLPEAIVQCGSVIQAVKKIIPSTWDTSHEDAKKGNYWPVWFAQGNKLQRQYYKLAELAFHALEQTSRESPVKPAAWEFYNMGISSCHTFWLSNWPWWHPDLSVAGATLLVKTIRSLPVTTLLKLEGEKLYHDLIHAIWQYHWSGDVEKRYLKHAKVWNKIYRELPIRV